MITSADNAKGARFAPFVLEVVAMFKLDRRRLGVLLGLGVWVFVFLLTKVLNPSLAVRLILLAVQQLMFIGIGLFCVRSGALIYPSFKHFLKGALYGVGLYVVNGILGALSLQIAIRLVGAETAFRLLAAERAAVAPFLDGENILSLVSMALMLTVGAPLSEELFFRGLILDTLKECIGTGAAVFSAALLFAGLHFYFIQFIPVLAAGVLLGLMFVRTDNLFVPILAHAMTNGLALAAWFVL